MNRRRFLKQAALGAAALAAAPAFIRKAFADESCPLLDNRALAQLSAGYKRAQKSGQPLLVLIIPETDGLKWERGRAFGELLNHGSDVEIAPLALFEVVCARMAELRRLVPSSGAGEPLMVAVDPAQLPAAVRRLDTELPSHSGDDWKQGETWEARQKRDDQISDRRVAVLAGLLRKLVTDPCALDANTGELAREVRARLVKHEVPGSRWANGGGCGTSVEGDDEALHVACGMGHVPKKSSRFLYFYAKTPAQEMRDKMKARAKEKGT